MKKEILISLMLVIILFSSSIINSQTKSVLVDQKNFNNISIDSIGHWNTSQNRFERYAVPRSFTWNIGSTQTLLGSQKLIDNQKYKHWENNFNPDENVVNHKSFQILATSHNFTSRFHLTHTGVTIKTSLEGTSATGGVIEFRDPWFIDFQDAQFGNQLRNRGMQGAVFRQRTSPFYPNATTQYEFGQTYRGVFLNQDYYIPNQPYYKVRVPNEQQISIHGQSRKFYPYYWTGNGVNYDNANNIETGIVFTQPNATATAVLKGQLMSNDQNGISSNSQRKLVRTSNGIYHLVYESMNSIWLVTKADNWWAPEVKLASNAKNPSIDYFGDMLFIAYEMWENGQLKLGFIQVDANSLSIIYSNSHYISSNQSDFGIVKPVVSCSQNQQFILYRTSPNSGLKYRLRTLNGINQWIWSLEYDVPYTNQNTLSWSVASNKVAEYNIAFQQGITKIYYLHADPRGDTLRFCSLTDLSNATGYNYNYNPSISYFSENYDKVMISWTGIRQLYMDKKIAKTNVEDMTAHNAVVKVGYGGNFSNYSSFSNNVKFTNNNSLNK